MMIEVDIKYYGMLTDTTGKTNEKMAFQEHCTVEELNNELKSKYVSLNNCNYQIAVNNKLVTDNSLRINSSAEVSLLPPFSGG